MLNNNGYTIEREIHGPNRHYNDVPQWDWQSTLTYFGAKEGQSKSYSVKTPDELSQVLGKDVPANSDKVQFVEIFLDQDDVPRGLKLQAALSAKANSD
jgi:pyruvate decarboxylase